MARDPSLAMLDILRRSSTAGNNSKVMIWLVAVPHKTLLARFTRLRRGFLAGYRHILIQPCRKAILPTFSINLLCPGQLGSLSLTVYLLPRKGKGRGLSKSRHQPQRRFSPRLLAPRSPMALASSWASCRVRNPLRSEPAMNGCGCCLPRSSRHPRVQSRWT